MEFEGLDEVVAYEGKQFVSDLEGPVTKNDNALEICEHVIQRGQKFFSLIKRYDDVLAYNLRRQGCKAGDTLRLILPFLKAYGLNDNHMHDFSRKHIDLIPGADKTMRFVQELMASFVVSASYEHYVSAVCEQVHFPFENAYCTRVSLDGFRMEEWEADILRKYAQEITAMTLIEIPRGAKSVRDFSPRDQKTIMRLDEIFWQEIPGLSVYRMLMDVNPMGGEEKAASIVDICKKTGVGTEDTVYIGDSITDIQALQLVRRGGGLPISFNGNEYAVREAEVAVLSDNTVVTSVLVEAFNRSGKDGVMHLVDNWNLEGIRSSGMIHDYLVRELTRVFPDQLPKVVRVTADNLEQVTEESVRFRKKVRSETIGALA